MKNYKYIILSLWVILNSCKENNPTPETNLPPMVSTISGFHYPEIIDFYPKICYQGSNVTIIGKNFMNQSPLFEIWEVSKGIYYQHYQLLSRSDSMMVIKLPLDYAYTDSSKIPIFMNKYEFKDQTYQWKSDTVIYSKDYLTPAGYFEIWPLIGTKGDCITIHDFSVFTNPTLTLKGIVAENVATRPFYSSSKIFYKIPENLSEGYLPINVTSAKLKMYNPAVTNFYFTAIPNWYDIEPKTIKASDSIIVTLNKTSQFFGGDFNRVNFFFKSLLNENDTSTIKFENLKMVKINNTTISYKIKVPDFTPGDYDVKLINLTDSKPFQPISSSKVTIK